MRIVFWGTPEFATPALLALLGEGFDVVGVVTQPDRPRGRSRSTLEPSPVKRVAVQEGVPVLQPERPRGPEFMEQFAALEPDLSVVVAYGHILPRAVIDLPARGTVNIHASLLPKLRGAAPIQWAIAEGHEETGITIMQMVPELDAGPILHVMSTPIAPDETGGELTQRLSELGAQAIVESLALLEAGVVQPREQDHSQATYAPKLDRDTCRVDWAESSDVIARRIRAFDPLPGAWSMLGDTDVKLFGARTVPDAAGSPGEVVSVDESGLVIGCGEGAVRVSHVHPSGRRRLAAFDWYRGRGVQVGDRFGASAS
jgi:methionyl-tRNA formyltransferase